MKSHPTCNNSVIFGRTLTQIGKLRLTTLCLCFAIIWGLSVKTPCC
jgi:hypothetical protein